MLRVLTFVTVLSVGAFAMLTATMSGAQTQVSEAEGLAAWDKAFEVFSHPRCVNCHVPDDNKPRWSGPSYATKGPYHGMGIVADDTRKRAAGLPCSACHTKQNLPFPGGAPGAPHWALAPVEMVWWEKSSAEICEQIKDPERNGGRTVEEVADHVGNDELVAWGWSPGPGRQPAPHSAAETVAFLLEWQSAGAPCPSSAAAE